MSIGSIAWQGPRPLTEEDRLYGRTEALDELTSRCQTYDVVEITAASGVGKTSFVAAGGIRALTAAGFSVVGPVRWSDALAHRDVVNSGTDGRAFANALYRVAIGLEGTEAEFSSMSPAELIQRAANGRKLVVVLDQMDELLRYKRNVGTALLSLAGEAAHRGRVPHVVIARTEFRERLSPVEVPGATVWNLYLDEITSSRVIRRIIAEPAKVAEVEITDDALQQLVDWWNTARTVSGSVVETGAATGEVGLLHLQALLVALQRWAEATGRDGDARIDLDFLKSFAAANGVDGPVDTGGPALVDAALVGHVEAMIGQVTNHERATDVVDADLTTWANGPRLMLARVAPFLSSGGYKVPQTIENLLTFGLAEELGLDNARRIASAFDERLGRGQRVELYADLKVGAEPAGIARTEGWSGLEAVNEMAQALVDAIKSLSSDKANVLREYNVTAEPVYELVHDQIGTALENWAGRFQARPIAAIDRVVARPGGAINHSLVPDAFADAADRAYWKIATLEPSGGYRLGGPVWSSYYVGLPGGGEDTTERLHLVDLHIIAADCASVAFVGCEFVNVTFSDACSLAGAAFIRCTLSGVRFTDCSLRGAFFRGCSLDGVTFQGGEHASVEQAAFKDCSSSSVLFDGLGEIRALIVDGATGGTWEFRDSPARHFLFSAAAPTRIDFVGSSLSHATFDGPVDVRTDSLANYVEGLTTLS